MLKRSPVRKCRPSELAALLVASYKAPVSTPVPIDQTACRFRLHVNGLSAHTSRELVKFVGVEFDLPLHLPKVDPIKVIERIPLLLRSAPDTRARRPHDVHPLLETIHDRDSALAGLLVDYQDRIVRYSVAIEIAPKIERIQCIGDIVVLPDVRSFKPGVHFFRNAPINLSFVRWLTEG